MKKITVLDIIDKIEAEVEQRPDSVEKMLHEVQMMQFKIRSIAGDISSLGSLHNSLIESLWRIGTIDSIVSDNFFELEDEDREALLSYVHNEEIQAQDAIKSALNMTASQNTPHPLRVEVYKEYQSKPTVN